MYSYEYGPIVKQHFALMNQLGKHIQTYEASIKLAHDATCHYANSQYYDVPAGTLKTGNYLIIKDRACKITAISTCK